jgi:hypothetical protein
MGQAAKAARENRTITVDFHDDSTYNTSDIFWRKGLTNEATTWLNVVIESHSHLNR